MHYITSLRLCVTVDGGISDRQLLVSLNCVFDASLVPETCLSALACRTESSDHTGKGENSRARSAMSFGPNRILIFIEENRDEDG
jgi:hypothetical protein